MEHKRKFFLNIPVQDLDRTKAFFAEIGFTFNAQFTNETGACMLIGEDSYAMLLTIPFFKGFTDREMCDTRTHTEGLFAFSCGSREEVDAIVNKAFAAGATPAKPSFDHGFMYGWSFYDLDGHHWELFWMDPANVA